MRQLLKEKLKQAKEVMKYQADKHRIDKQFVIGDWVYLKSKNIHTERPSKKLDYMMLGPFKITGITQNFSYQLALPPQYHHIYPIHHVSMLEPHYRNPPDEEALGPIIVDDEPEFTIKRILKYKCAGRGVKYLVKWEGWGEEDATWEPYDALKDTEAMEAYEKRALTMPTRKRKGKY